MEKTSLLFASEFSYFFACLLLSRSFSISLFFLEGARSLSLSLRAKDTSSIATRPFSLSPSLARFPAASKRQKQLVPRPSKKREKVRTRCSLAIEKKRNSNFQTSIFARLYHQLDAVLGFFTRLQRRGKLFFPQPCSHKKEKRRAEGRERR